MTVKSNNAKTPLKPVLSMSQDKDRRHDFVAFTIVAALLIAFTGSGLYILKNLSSEGFVRPFTSLTRFIDNLPSFDFFEKKFRMAPIKPRVQPFPKDRLLVRQGYDLYMKNNFEQAITLFDQAVAVNPENPEAFYWRGSALIQMEKIDAAIDDFKKTMTLRPNHAEACDNLGWLYMRKAEYDTSLAYLNRSIELRPNNAWAYYNRGFVYSKKKEMTKALQDAEKACGLGYDAGCEMVKKHRKK
jgi:tetratricopeptide (TPR) repeat protein